VFSTCFFVLSVIFFDFNSTLPGTNPEDERISLQKYRKRWRYKRKKYKCMYVWVGGGRCVFLINSFRNSQFKLPVHLFVCFFKFQDKNNYGYYRDIIRSAYKSIWIFYGLDCLFLSHWEEIEAILIMGRNIIEALIDLFFWEFKKRNHKKRRFGDMYKNVWRGGRECVWKRGNKSKIEVWKVIFYVLRSLRYFFVARLISIFLIKVYLFLESKLIIY